MIYTARQLFLFLIAALLITGCVNASEEVVFPTLNNEQPSNKVVAIYKGDPITSDELREFLAVQGFLDPDAPVNDSSYRKDALYQLIVDKYVGEEAVNTDWVNQQSEQLWNEIEHSYSQKIREQAYEELDITEEVVKKHIKAHFQSKQFFRDKISEEDVKGYFDKAGYSAEFKTVEEAKEPILQKLVQKAINNYVQDELKRQVKYVQVS
ncbi:hypothetical protein LZP85_12165 [Priestia flexa]|uniref:Peptidylprolyl isomerase n=1 Tax=Priestia flexa TaxID=86664 RepID=A0A8I1MFP4_9BACI|nr:hypothetical protein [Priestia flexa]MBN8251788.1 hypothetical protein [Priestia flexa]MBN8434796.1 hypothetical protein [Priestia flexa]MCA0967574.1 hypothetical protein [Priestia flexa]UIR28742.1 hypothetical protein LZP85_12165 [Priestia flexa]UZW64856.1 hypothetical protein OC195_11125 [Priestia flexa]